jgi:hypothetical protein
LLIGQITPLNSISQNQEKSRGEMRKAAKKCRHAPVFLAQRRVANLRITICSYLIAPQCAIIYMLFSNQNPQRWYKYVFLRNISPLVCFLLTFSPC